MVPLIPILGMVSCFILMLSLPIITWLRFIIWMAVGVAIYFCYGYRHGHEETPYVPKEDFPDNNIPMP